MASFFDKVPLEVREQVYRELLVNQDGAIELDGRYCNKRKLYTAILRTCKQAYTEASAVLYEQNHFRFESWPEATSLDRNGILEGNFARIKQLEIVHGGDASDGPLNAWHYWKVPEESAPTPTMRYVAASGCLLRIPYLNFSVFKPRQRAILSDDDIYPVDDVSTIAYNGSLQKIVADLEIKTMIEVGVEGLTEEYCSRFQYFVNGIGYMKQWAMTHERHSEMQYGRRCFYWTWILRPATAATQDKVPKSLEDDEEDLNPTNEAANQIMGQSPT